MLFPHASFKRSYRRFFQDITYRLSQNFSESFFRYFSQNLVYFFGISSKVFQDLFCTFSQDFFSVTSFGVSFTISAGDVVDSSHGGQLAISFRGFSQFCFVIVSRTSRVILLQFFLAIFPCFLPELFPESLPENVLEFRLFHLRFQKKMLPKFLPGLIPARIPTVRA